MRSRKSARKGWKRLALVLPPLLIALFVMAICQSTVNNLWAQAKQPQAQKPGTAQPVQPGRPAPTPNPVEIQRLVSVKTQFLQEINQAMNSPQTAANHSILHTKMIRGIIQEDFVKWESDAKTATIAPLTQAQLRDARDAIAHEIDEALKLEREGKGGAGFIQGSFHNHLFTGKIQPVGGPLSLPEISSESAKQQ